ncbi:MAG: hypothetical protein K2J00_01290 [Bacteroidaceae bacterium]|nr:hypothetical protein [Bacteroidaceae bacterium]
MTHTDFYARTTALPLLQGIAAEHILRMQERGALRIVSMEPEEGDIIVAGQHCKTLTMLMDGTLNCTTRGDGWTLEEEMHAPAIIEEEALWSLSQTYHHTYRPTCDGHLLVIDRAHVMNTLMNNDVFRINLLTRMSTRIERNHMQVMRCQSMEDTVQKILRFVQDISATQVMPKRLYIKMTTLAHILGETRLRISGALHRMQQVGKASLSREQITIYQY